MKKLASVINVPVDCLYKVIHGEENGDKISEVNITDEIIALLEAHGYKVVKPVNSEKIKKNKVGELI